MDNAQLEIVVVLVLVDLVMINSVLDVVITSISTDNTARNVLGNKIKGMIDVG